MFNAINTIIGPLFDHLAAAEAKKKAKKRLKKAEILLETFQNEEKARETYIMWLNKELMNAKAEVRDLQDGVPAPRLVKS